MMFYSILFAPIHIIASVAVDDLIGSHTRDLRGHVRCCLSAPNYMLFHSAGYWTASVEEAFLA